MATIVVRRSADLGGLLRRITIEVDGRTAAKVKRDATVSIDVPPGRHTVRAKMDWMASRPMSVDVQEGSVVTVQVEATERTATFTGSFVRPRSALDLTLIS